LPRRYATPLWRRIASRDSGRIDQWRIGRPDSGKPVDSIIMNVPVILTSNAKGRLWAAKRLAN
jgi:hypothetical protein